MFLGFGHFMSAVCLEHCIWDRYESVTVPFIGNIKCLVLLLLECCDIKPTTQKTHNKKKKGEGQANCCVFFLPEYIAAGGACPTERPENQPSPVQSKLSFGPNITGNKVQILDAMSEIVDLKSRYSQAILISETPPQVQRLYRDFLLLKRDLI